MPGMPWRTLGRSYNIEDDGVLSFLMDAGPVVPRTWAALSMEWASFLKALAAKKAAGGDADASHLAGCDGSSGTSATWVGCRLLEGGTFPSGRGGA